jgi:hypothetical protein
VSSGGAKGTGLNTLNLTETDNHLSTVTITGANAFTLNLTTDSAALAATPPTANVASALHTIDGSAATGALTITAGAPVQFGTSGIYLTDTGLTIHGGTGGDTITNGADSGVITEGATAANTATNSAHNALTVTGTNATINDSASAANDTITLGGTGDSATLGSGNTVTATLAGFSDSVTLGSGTNVTVHVSDDANTTAGAGGDNQTVTFGNTGVATVTDLLHYNANTAADYLTLGGHLSGNTLAFAAPVAFASGTTTLGAATTLPSGSTGSLTFAQLVSGAESHTANTVTWFQFGGSTYVVDSGAATGTTTPATTLAGAELVKIAGTVDLSHATLTTAGAIHFA